MVKSPKAHVPIKTSLRRLYELLTPRDRRNALILFGMMLVGAGLEVIGVAAIPAFVSGIVSPGRLSELPIVGPIVGDQLGSLAVVSPETVILGGALILVVIFGCKNAFLMFNHYVQLRYVANRRVSMSSKLMSCYMNAPYPFFLNRNTSELLRNVDREVNAICNNVLSTILELSTKLIILVAVLALLFVVEPLITLGWMAFLGTVAVAGLLATSSRLRRFGLVQQKNRTILNRALYQSFHGIKEVRVLGRERFFSEQVVGAIARIAGVVRAKSFIMKIIPPVSELVAIIGMLALACGLVLLGRSTESILVTLSLFVVGLVRLRELCGSAMAQFADLRFSLVSLDPVYLDLKDLSASDAREVEEEGSSDIQLRDEITLRDVWFQYDGSGDHSLKGVDIHIPAGSAVGLVGSTGAGKTTIVDLVLGLLRPTGGEVLVDGRNIAELGYRNWRSHVGYVPQSIYLLDDTIRRNIAFGIPDEETDDRAIAAACRAAQLDDFLERQPHGLDTLVGEAGVRLSGGERQRIGIARALYRDPDVLIFDEATSALDNITEAAIVEAVEKLRGDRTIIMIAHRLSTVRNCDRLYYLERGRVEGTGDYEQLREDHESFRRMAAA